MLLAGGGGLILADWLSFPVMYRGMGLCMLACVVVTWYAPEPLVPSGAPQTLRAAVVEPFLDYFARPGAWLMLAFILLYKLGDTMAAAMTTPFYLDLGFSKTEIYYFEKPFTKSFFKLDFYDTMDGKSQTNYFTIIFFYVLANSKV
jgi:PAT family beta-lactamase induction signal transducer AmpG